MIRLDIADCVKGTCTWPGEPVDAGSPGHLQG